MVWTAALRLPLYNPLVESTAQRTSVLGRRQMGILDCGLGISAHLANRTAQPRLAWTQLGHGLGSGFLTLSAIYFSGGRSWLRHFAFSICFMLTTLPWPGGLENFLIQGLMQVVAWVTVG